MNYLAGTFCSEKFKYSDGKKITFLYLELTNGDSQYQADQKRFYSITRPKIVLCLSIIRVQYEDGYRKIRNS